MNQPKSDEDMIKEYQDKKASKKIIKPKKKKKIIVETKRKDTISEAPKDESEAGAREEHHIEKYHNQNIKRAKEKVEKNDFTLRKKIFLKLFIDTFLSFDVYNKYDEYFEILLIDPIKEDTFNLTIKSFYESVALISLFGQSLSIDIINKDCQVLVEAEVYRYIINFLQDSKTTNKKLEGLIRKFKPDTKKESSFGMFCRILIFLIEDIINWKKSSEYLFNDITKEDEKMKIIQNTINNFEQLSLISLNKELLANLKITDEEFSDIFLSEEMGDFILGLSDKAYINYINLYEILKYDFLVENFQAFKRTNKDDTLLSEKKDLIDINKLSLYHFSQGAIDGLTMLVLIKIFFIREKDAKHNNNREIIIRYLEKHRGKINEEFLDFLEYLIIHHKFKNILLLVFISRALCLSRVESFKLSEALGFGKKTTFDEHFNSLFSSIFPNYIYIK